MKFAVSINAHLDAEKPERGYDFVRHAYVPYLQTFGIVPILIPNNLVNPRAFMAALGVEGVILTGGEDIAPERYGQPNIASKGITLTRDQMEYDLLEWAVEYHRPVLGICRGIQMLNVFFGGGLVQDISSHLHSPVNHSGDGHPIRFTDPRMIRVVGAEEIRVNSHHHQGITSDLLAKPLEAYAFCPADGVIEGVIHRSEPILGVQWHPERPTPSLDYDRRLLRDFLQGTFWLETSS